MSDLGRLKLVGSCRVSFTAPLTASFISNSGAFGTITTPNASEVQLDPPVAGRQLQMGDVLMVTSEGTTFAWPVINRFFTLFVRVRIFDDLGAQIEQDFAVDWYSIDQ